MSSKLILEELTKNIKKLKMFEERSDDNSTYQRVPNGLVITKENGHVGEFVAVFVPIDDSFFEEEKK